MNDHGSSTALARADSASGMLQATEGADGSRQMSRVSTHAYALTQSVNTQIQSAMLMAKQYPRSLDEFRLKLLERCKTAEFAEVARYAKPQGWVTDENGKYVLDERGKKIRNYVRGWSVRFTDAAIQLMGNIAKIDKLIDETPLGLLYQVGWVDYETNTWCTQEVLVPKTVERKRLNDGQFALDQRVNNYGDIVFIVPASPDEIKLAAANLRAKARRDEARLLLPGDVLAEAERVVAETQRADAHADPIKARKKLVDAFATIGIKPTDLVEYLGGRPLDALTPDMILELRAVFTMVKEDGVRWRDVLETSTHVDREATGEEEPANDSPAAKLRAKLMIKAKELGTKDREQQEARAAMGKIATDLGVQGKSVAAVVGLTKAGKSVADIARYGREQTGIEDEVLVGEIVSRTRKAGLLPAETAPSTEAKGSEPPASPATPQGPPTGGDVGQGASAAEKGATTRQRRPAGGKDPQARRVAIAEQEGVTPETVAAVEELAGSGDDEVAIAAALRVKGFPVDAPTVAAILSALKK
jgi:hypothetical protein